MKKSIALPVALFLILAFVLSFVACMPDAVRPGNESATDAGQVEKIQLSAPTVTISDSGVATWPAVEGATRYAYQINDGAVKTTRERSVFLMSGQSVRVKAIGDGKTYIDSDFSAAETYVPPVRPGDCAHQDTDSDDVCDVCGICVKVVLDFYAVNDLHGKYEDTDAQPGVDEFTTFMKELYADPSAYEILLSSGDMWQGTVESSGTHGALMTEWMNRVGFVSMTLGNHEFDWGGEGIAANQALADFPFLAINVRYHGAPVEYCRPSVIVERGGVRIGVIGAIGDCLSSISGEYTDGMSFVTGDDLTALVKAEAIRLRNEEGCDLIVYSIHSGYGSNLSDVTDASENDLKSYYDLGLSDGYVDLVFEGHTHKSYILKDRYGVYHLQGGGENRGISYVSLTYHLIGNSYTVNEVRQISSFVYGDTAIADDPLVDELFRKYFPDSDPYTTVIGTNTEYRRSQEICDQVAELYLGFGKTLWSDYDIVLGGGYLNTRSPYNLPAGEVTYAQLFSLLPFDNQIVLGSISGEKLKSQFIDSSNSSYHCAYDPSFVDSIADDETYYIVVDSYTSTYAKNGITEVARAEAGVFARDLLCDFIADGGWDGKRSAAEDE